MKTFLISLLLNLTFSIFYASPTSDSLKLGNKYKIITANYWETTGIFIAQDSVSIYFRLENKTLKINRNQIYSIELINSTDSTKIYAKNKEDDEKDKIYKFDAGIGGTNIGFCYGFSYTLGFKNNILLKCNFRNSSEYGGIFSANKDPLQRFTELGILCGFYVKPYDRWFLSLSAGLSYIDARFRGNYLYDYTSSNWLISKYEEINYKSVGIPIEGDFFFKFNNSIGIGIKLFANINSKKFTDGLMFSLMVGKL